MVENGHFKEALTLWNCLFTNWDF